MTHREQVARQFLDLMGAGLPQHNHFVVSVRVFGKEMFIAHLRHRWVLCFHLAGAAVRIYSPADDSRLPIHRARGKYKQDLYC